MTFDDLNSKLGGSEVASDWSQHPNGGGWLHKTAKVDASAIVGPDAAVWGRVSGNAWVYGNARVSGNAWVYGNAWVSGDARVHGNAQVSGNARVHGDARVSGDAQVYGNARVSGDARVHGDAQVYGNARVSGDARVYGNARVSGDARVHGDAWKKSPLFIVGSRYSLTNTKHGHIQIGCKCETFAWWQSDEALAFARANNFSEAEIEEYRAYVELFVKIGK